jgi:hypothetical protein
MPDERVALRRIDMQVSVAEAGERLPELIRKVRFGTMKGRIKLLPDDAIDPGDLFR